MYLVLFPIALLLAVLGVAVKYFKWHWLIAGYNTMPREKKEKVDVAGLGNFLGNWMFILAGLFLVRGLLGRLKIVYLDLIFVSLLFILMFHMLIQAQRYDHNPKTKSDRIILGLVAGFLLLIGLAVPVLIYFSSLPAPVYIEEGHLNIGGIYGGETPITEIREIALEESMPKILRKVNGFDGGMVRKGRFRVEELGEGRLYIHSAKGPYLFITTPNSYIIINYREGEQTKKLYQDLTAALE